MAKRKKSSRRPQRKHTKHTKTFQASRHDKRHRLDRRNPFLRITSRAIVPLMGVPGALIGTLQAVMDRRIAFRWDANITQDQLSRKTGIRIHDIRAYELSKRIRHLTIAPALEYISGGTFPRSIPNHSAAKYCFSSRITDLERSRNALASRIQPKGRMTTLILSFCKPTARSGTSISSSISIP